MLAIFQSFSLYSITHTIFPVRLFTCEISVETNSEMCIRNPEVHVQPVMPIKQPFSKRLYPSLDQFSLGTTNLRSKTNLPVILFPLLGVALQQTSTTHCPYTMIDVFTLTKSSKPCHSDLVVDGQDKADFKCNMCQDMSVVRTYDEITYRTPNCVLQQSNNFGFHQLPTHIIETRTKSASITYDRIVRAFRYYEDDLIVQCESVCTVRTGKLINTIETFIINLTIINLTVIKGFPSCLICFVVRRFGHERSLIEMLDLDLETQIFRMYLACPITSSDAKTVRPSRLFEPHYPPNTIGIIALPYKKHGVLHSVKETRHR